MKKLLRNKKGFTLIELIVVILILAILAAILVPAILKYVDQANFSKGAANARSNYSEAAILKAANDDYDLATHAYKSGCTYVAPAPTATPARDWGVQCTWKTGQVVTFYGDVLVPADYNAAVAP